MIAVFCGFVSLVTLLGGDRNRGPIAPWRSPPRVPPVEVTSIEQLQGLIGQELGPTDWVTVTQEEIDKFAEVSRDDHWIHVDVERAKTESPFGTTVANGNLTVSLTDGLRREPITQSGVKLGDKLTDVDRGSLRSGKRRWENRVQFTRLRLKERGLLKGGSQRGVWELSDEGRKRLKKG